MLHTAHLAYNNCLACFGLKLETKKLWSDLLFLSKLKFGLTHLTLTDFSNNTSRKRTNRFISSIGNEDVATSFVTLLDNEDIVAKLAQVLSVIFQLFLEEKLSPVIQWLNTIIKDNKA